MPEAAPWQPFATDAVDSEFTAVPFASPIGNFYMTDPISRASETMAECAAAFLSEPRKTGTDG